VIPTTHPQFATGNSAGNHAIGKPLGITLFSWLAVKRGWSTLPHEVNWQMLHGAAWLGGIGFTVALFIASLAFEDTPRLADAKLSVLVGSLVAGIIGRQLVVRALRPRDSKAGSNSQAPPQAPIS
jgi:NhaA family Na+:H+ antiporter